MLLLIFLASLCAGGAVYFTVSYISIRRKRATLTQTERAYLEIAEQEELAEVKSLLVQARERLRKFADEFGYRGTLVPVLLALGFVYLGLILVFRLFGLPDVAGLILGLPAALLSVTIISRRAERKRRERFSVQLLQAFSLLAGQLEAGFGVNRALELILPSIQDPLHAELEQVLLTSVGSKPLVEAMRDLSDRFPSRAMSMFVTALELYRVHQASLAPVLRQAANMLQRNHELAAEAIAELAQTKAEFYGVASIVAFIAALTMLTQGAKAFGTPVGVGVLLVAGVLFGTGLWRAQRLFRRTRDEL